MASDDGFTHADEVLADGEVVGSEPTLDPVQPVISKGEAEDSEKGGADKLKATLLISGAVVAVIGAILAIAKKMKVSTTAD